MKKVEIKTKADFDLYVLQLYNEYRTVHFMLSDLAIKTAKLTAADLDVVYSQFSKNESKISARLRKITSLLSSSIPVSRYLLEILNEEVK